jgi:hypothetical protein
MAQMAQHLQDVASECMKAATTLVGNRDIENMVPLIIRSINHPTEVQDTVHKLASTTFVQQVWQQSWYYTKPRSLCWQQCTCLKPRDPNRNCLLLYCITAAQKGQ